MDVACYGNHEWDVGEQQLRRLVAACDFPWLISNVVEDADAFVDADAAGLAGRAVAGGQRYWVTERAGVRVAFLGLMEAR